MLKYLLVAVLPWACLGQLLAGGKMDVAKPEDDADIVEAAKFALTKITECKADNAERTLGGYNKVQTQVVAGILYTMDLKVNTKNIVGQSEDCSVTVWSQPWKAEKLKLSGSPSCCMPPMASRQLGMVGAPMDKNVNDPEVQKALGVAVDQLNARSNDLYIRKAGNVAKVTSQVVAGVKYHFEGVEMAATNCRQGTQQLSLCSVSPQNTDVDLCNFDVLVQLWMPDQYQLMNEKCQRM